MTGVIDPLTGLTHLQEAYSQLLAVGTPEVDAYPQAGYDTSNCTTKTVYESASKLANLPKVMARVQQLKAQVQAAMVGAQAWTLDRMVSQAEKHMDAALTGGFRGVSAANGALEIIGRATGLLADKPKGEPPAIITRITVVLNRGRGPEGEDRIIEAETRALEAGQVAPGVETSWDVTRIEP